MLNVDTICREEFNRLQGRNWTSLCCVADKMQPSWACEIPANIEYDLLASGPGFVPAHFGAEQVCSEMLFEQAVPDSRRGKMLLSAATEDGVVVLMDEQNCVVSLSDNTGRHAEWIGEIVKAEVLVEAYYVPLERRSILRRGAGRALGYALGYVERL